MRFKTKNNRYVIVPKITLEHMNAHYDVDWNVVKEAISKISYEGGFLKIAVDMGRVIGYTSCVSVTSDDEIIMVYRKNRKGMTPMVLGRKPEPTNLVVIILREGTYDGSPILVTSWYGNLAPMEPWDARRKNSTEEVIKESDAFWNSHALIYDENVIDLGKVCWYKDGTIFEVEPT